jgi:hypothetical protein
VKVGSKGGPGHLVRRATSTLFRRRTSPDDAAWATSQLSEAERRLFDRMTPADQAHSVRVARRVDAAVGDEDGADVAVIAALLHDVGKGEARLGIYGRVVATLCDPFADDQLAQAWSQRSGITRRIGLYLRYPKLGAESLQLAGSSPLVVAWSAEHHEPEESWTVPVEFGRLLQAADY